MISTDKTAFAQLLLTTANQYHYWLSHSVLEIYWYCLKDYSLTEIKAAFLTYAKTVGGNVLMPQPSDILRILSGDNPERIALLAWEKVKQAIRCVGGYQSIAFDDFLIHAVIDAMGSWMNLCQKTEEELSLMATEFQQRYCRYLRYRPYAYSSYLIGLFEHHNRLHQQRVPEPLLFGHHQAALMTYLAGKKPDEGLKPFQSIRSAHQLVANVIKPIEQSRTPVEKSFLLFPSSDTRTTHEPE